MINLDSQLKLQAYLDGELAAAEIAEVKSWIDSEPQAKALLDELRSVKAVLKGGEAECLLPETREFFWSKIEREIERESARTAAPAIDSWVAWVVRHFLPLSGVALMTCFLGILFIESGTSVSPAGEIEMASADVGSYTFRDSNETMTAVWLYNRGDDSATVPALASTQPE